MSERKYGWKPQQPDERDFKFIPPTFLELPDKIDLRDKCPPVYNQQALGSCTSQAIAGLVEYTTMKLNHFNFMPARLFIYYNERALEGTVDQDSGAIIRDGMKVVHQFGVPKESLCPYDISKFTEKPSDAAYKNGLQHLVTKYEAVQQDENHIKACLAAGNPIVFGFIVFESFESEEVATTGIMPMPKFCECCGTITEQVLGGHAVGIYGVDTEKQVYIVRNSWGEEWGDKGYFTMPFDFAHSPLCSDFWTIDFVKNF